MQAWTDLRWLAWKITRNLLQTTKLLHKGSPNQNEMIIKRNDGQDDEDSGQPELHKIKHLKMSVLV